MKVVEDVSVSAKSMSGVSSTVSHSARSSSILDPLHHSLNLIVQVTSTQNDSVLFSAGVFTRKLSMIGGWQEDKGGGRDCVGSSSLPPA